MTQERLHAAADTITLELDIHQLKRLLQQHTLHVSDIRCCRHQDKLRLQQLLLQAMQK